MIDNHDEGKSADILIRPITVDDLPVLSEHWYDQMVLYQQNNSSITLAPNARDRWEQDVAERIVAGSFLGYSCEIASDLVGCILGQIQANGPGLEPPNIGVVEALVIDLHTRHRRRSIADALLGEFFAFLRESGIDSCLIRVYAGALVEQTYWKSRRAAKLLDLFLVKI